LFVDGKPLGTLPLSQPIDGLVPGQHVVRVKDKNQETSTFVEVRFGRTTDANIELGAAQVISVPSAAVPTLVEPPALRKPAWVRPAAIGVLGAGVASAVIGLTFHARASSTASDLNALAASNKLQRKDAQLYGDVDQNTNMARGFYIAAAVLAATG